MAEVLLDWADALEEDYDPSNDGDDHPDNINVSPMGVITPRFMTATTAHLKALTKPTATKVVPWVSVGQGDHDQWAVYAVKRAEARRKRRLREFMRKPKEVQMRWGADFSEAFGAKRYTKQRHQTLAKWFDANAIAAMRADKGEENVSDRDLQIAKQLGWLNAFYNRRYAISYLQVRPSQLYAAANITRADCSGSGAGSCHWANILPKVDWRYTNTWVQVQFGSRVSSINQALPGDFVFYGSPSHVGVYLGNGLIWSFGSYPAKILRWNYRSDFLTIRRFVAL